MVQAQSPSGVFAPAWGARRQGGEGDSAGSQTVLIRTGRRMETIWRELVLMGLLLAVVLLSGEV
jgi:hypothetical protein